MQTNIFEKASHINLRFKTVRGLHPTEVLWDLPLTSGDSFNLDDIAKGLSSTLKASEVESFVKPNSSVESQDTLRFDIVKHIIKYKLALIERNEKAAVTRDRNNIIRDIISQKKNNALHNKSVEELEAELID